MSKKFIGRGRHTVLPLAGDAVSEILFRARALPEIVFLARDRSESILEFWNDIVLTHGMHECILKRTSPELDKQDWMPLLNLLGQEVSDALAEEDGHLRVEFAFGMVLSVTPTTGYEAWHFQHPRPGRPLCGDPTIHLSMHGAHGHLI